MGVGYGCGYMGYMDGVYIYGGDIWMGIWGCGIWEWLWGVYGGADGLYMRMGYVVYIYGGGMGYIWGICGLYIYGAMVYGCGVYIWENRVTEDSAGGGPCVRRAPPLPCPAEQWTKSFHRRQKQNKQ